MIKTSFLFGFLAFGFLFLGTGCDILFPPDITRVAKVEDLTIKMVSLDSATFLMGSDDSKESEGPTHLVFVDSFLISEYETTNSQFAQVYNYAVSKGYISPTSVVATYGDKSLIISTKSFVR